MFTNWNHVQQLEALLAEKEKRIKELEDKQTETAARLRYLVASVDHSEIDSELLAVARNLEAGNADA